MKTSAPLPPVQPYYILHRATGSERTSDAHQRGVQPVQDLQRGVGDPFKLALVSAPGFGYELIKQAINNSPVKSDILELGYVRRRINAISHGGAETWSTRHTTKVSASPPVEAMACGCPVISSNAASLPEILDDAALFFS